MNERSFEVSGPTVEDAVSRALKELGVGRDQVEVEVLDPGGRAFLGLLGAKEARVRVTVRDDPVEVARAGRAFLLDVLHEMGIAAEVQERVGEDGTIRVDISGEGLGLIIGRRGQTLDALQYLVGIVANRHTPVWHPVVLDAEGYRARREAMLRSLARRVAQRVRRTGRKMVLDPMPASERRVIHLALHSEEGIETRSEGRDPYRRVVVVPRK